MKAKFVYEHIEFERGIEPSKAMDIGYGDLSERFIKVRKFPDVYSVDLMHYRNEYVIWVKTFSSTKFKSKEYFDKIFTLLGEPYFKTGLRKNIRTYTIVIHPHEKFLKIIEKAYEKAYREMKPSHRNLGGNNWKYARDYLRENIEFERGLEPKQALSLGRRALIKKWFDDLNISPDQYTISVDFSIKVKGDLFLQGLDVTSLPDNLSVGGDLWLEDTNITSLPDNLSVGGDLDLEDINITSLPDNLSVGGYLDLKRTKITSLPDDLSVGGKIFKDF